MMNVPSRARSGVVLFGIAMACTSVALKLPLVAYGLPAHFSADEATILKDPFRLAFLYAHGNFAHSTNLFLWLLQAWYALLFPAGWLLGYWNGLGQFRESIAAESVIVLVWGRLLGVAASACAVYVLSRVVARVVQGWRERVLIMATLAVNPVDLVSAAWLKYDGTAGMVNAILLATFVKYLDSDATRDRRWLYVLAIAAPAFRIDFVVFPITLLFYDLLSRRRWLDVAGAITAGVAAYLLLTLRPVVLVYRALSASIPNSEINVETPFEGHILTRLFSDVASGDLWRTVVSGFGFYGWLSVGLGIPLLAVCAGSVARDRRVRWLVVLSAIELCALLLSSAQSTRYWLSASVCLFLATGLAAGTAKPAIVRLGLLSCVFILCASLTAETLRHLMTRPDPRVEAAQYILARSTPTDVIAIEGYLNPGSHAAISECPEELLKKSVATQEAGVGTGETFAEWAKHRAPDCRRVLEIEETDRFAASSYSGRWINTHDPVSLEGTSPLPKFFTTGVQYEDGSPQRHAAFAAWIRQRYTRVGVFEPAYQDPRLRTLLTSTPYHARLYVYERRP